MSLDVVAKQKFLRGLKCAYTGREITVRMIGTGSSCLYFSEDAFDPGDWHATPAALLAALGTRDGIAGAAREGSELACPYTGRKMTLRHDPAFGYGVTGGYRPSRPVADPFLFARMMMTRKGVAPENAPKPVRISLAGVEEPEEDVDRVEISVDAAMQAAEDILKPSMPVRTTVTVPGGAPRKAPPKAPPRGPHPGRGK